jgi:DNA-directed RNA polymerase specialized sigma24 family protein
MQLEDREPADLEGYELFRRAIEQRDEQAWAEGIARYRPWLISWARRASAAIREHYDDIADDACARAWVALAPKHFARFSTLAALLSYLRSCVHTTAIDCARKEMQFERLIQTITAADVATPEQIVLDQFDRAELWRIASSVARTKQERYILIASYVYDLSPRAILSRHPDLFADATEIYSTKRHLLDRLRRCPEMRELYEEQAASSLAFVPA